MEQTIYKVGTNDYDNTGAENAYDETPDSGVGDFLNMDPEQRQKAEETWRNELAKTEEEINTLRQVLASKMKHATELKRKLGITVWKEFQQDLGAGVKNIQETTASGLGSSLINPAYQKTSEIVKAAGEKSFGVFGNLGESFRSKLGEVKNNQMFKSFEERVGSTVYSVKNKMSGSRSNSMNFDEASENGRRGSQTANNNTSTIAE